MGAGHRVQRINASRVQIRQLDRTNSPAEDPQFTELAGDAVFTAAVEMTAQLNPSGLTFRQRPQGDDPSDGGTLIIRPEDIDLDAPGFVPHIGDRLTRIDVGTAAEEVVQLVFTGIKSVVLRGALLFYEITVSDLKAEKP